MEPVTHVLTGACLARSGLNRKAAYATAVMAVAAEFPDIDTLWSLRGPVSGFAHHRGITHTFLGIPFEAALLVGLAWLFHRHRTKTRSTRGSVRVQDAAPVRWGVLFLCAVLALLSHILLDYTNNYGVRPFFPFSAHWYAGSFVFIVDPLILVLLSAGLVLPLLFGLIKGEIGSKREVFQGAGWARAALVGLVALWCLRAYAHGRALELAGQQTMRAPVDTAENQPGPSTEDTGALAPPTTRPMLPSSRSLASPDPFSPFRWYLASDFGPVYQLATVELLQNAYVPYRLLNKPEPSPCLRAAQTSRLGQVYLNWSPMPWLSASTDIPGELARADAACIVRLEDPRFMSSSSLLTRGKQAPLTGTVLVDPHGRIVAEGMDQRFGK